MGRDPRYVPPDSLQHVTDVIFQNRRLLRPSETVNERFLGVLGEAQAKYGMVVCAVVVLSSHYHLLLRPKDAQHLASFMCFFKSNLSKEVGGRLRGWKGHFFDQRYHSATVSSAEGDQVGVLRYVLAHGVKEHLVDTVREWPGVHCGAHLMDGRRMVGRWIDRTAGSAARGRGEPGDEESHGREVEVELSPLPCWEHLPGSSWRRAVVALVEEIDAAGRAERQVSGKTSLGVDRVLAEDPLGRPATVEKSPQPRFHARGREELRAMKEIWQGVITAFREAAARLRSGDRQVQFPPGTFPPGLPFVPFGEVNTLARGRPV